MKLDLSKYAPPGINLNIQKNTFICGGALALLWSFSWFFRLAQGYESLFKTSFGGEKTLRAGAVMPDYVEVLGAALIGFAVLALVMLGFVIYNYAYHRQGSMSIYLMRRLPDRWERHRRCLTLPLVAVMLCAAAAFVLLCVYYLIYMLVTPDECLALWQWGKIWRLWI